MTNTNKNTSFVIAYSFWSYILIAIVLFNYILFRSIVVDNNSFLYLVTFIFDYIVLITFFLLVFYQFYNAIFNSNILLSFMGILFLIFGTLKLYVMEINIHNIIEFLFFAATLILTIKILFPIIKSKDTIELERGIYVFILLSLLASNINYIIISANKLIDSDIFHYISTHISTYTSKLSAFSFLILIIAYILIFIKEIIMKNINKAFVFVILAIILSILSIFLFGANFLLIIISFFNALGIVMYLPFTIYMVVMIMFFITLFSSFITSIVSKNYYPKLIIFTLLILAGLDMSNFSLRLISIFAILEMSNIQNSKKEDISYLTNNDL
ncbi:WESB_1763 family membrane protein [uncultured Brachyspira sp.]|uniref:WESB_1763 family membrane protein n=1 Tax=uncultured Brachyspira sp. TaxID=221953 RepID=UPI00260C6321|nr:WESB_1763 family membrane protein [uncultured Brachyspira sp.]